MDVEHLTVSTLDGLDVLLFMAVGWCYASGE
jgi:hypothetical protein